jgi:phosphatidylglycerol:prolipoprotein diacylglycerol transferase
MMMPFLNLFGVAIAFPPLIVLVGIWLGSSLAEKHADRFKVPASELFNLIFIGLAAFVLGGRLGYAAQHPAAFVDAPLNLLSRNFGLFDPFSGAALGVIAAVVYGQRKNLKLWPTLDALTPAIAVFMLAVPLANLASGSAFGAPTNLPWGISLWGETRQPVQIYEALAAGMILVLLWPAKAKKNARPGNYFLQFVAASALARLFFEGLRGSSPVTVLNLRVYQLVAWVVLAAALWGLARLSAPQKSEKKNG